MNAVSESEVRVLDVRALRDRVSARLKDLVLGLPTDVGQAPRSQRPKKATTGKAGGDFAAVRRRAGAGLEVKHAESPRKGAAQLIEYIHQAFAEALGTTSQVVVIDASDPLIERTVRQVVERVPEIVRARRSQMTEKNIDALVDLFLNVDPIAEVRHAIEADNARERARLVSEVRCLTSKQVAEGAGHRAANASVTGSRWKQQGKVFSLPWKGSELYPAFQFRDGQPHPTIAKVLKALPKRMSPWQVAFWFTSSNSWLRGTTPAERLDDEAAVLTAAEREGEAVVG